MKIYSVSLRSTSSSQIRVVSVEANTEAGAASSARTQNPGWMVSGTPRCIG